MDMYYYVLHVTNWVAMATMYMLHIVSKLLKSEEKGQPRPISTILITDRQIWYVSVGLQLLSSKLPFYIILN